MKPSWINQVGPESNDMGPYEKHRNTQRRRPCEGGG